LKGKYSSSTPDGGTLGFFTECSIKKISEIVKNYTKEYQQAILYVIDKNMDACKFVRYSEVYT
jgi:hypothetical protein